jgi:hypothetical protein
MKKEKVQKRNACYPMGIFGLTPFLNRILEAKNGQKSKI